MTAVAAAIVHGGGAVGATASPSHVSGYYSGGGTSNVSTGSTIAAGAGGVAPYGYAWTQIGASPYTWTIGSAAAATTNFTAQSLPEGVFDTTDFRVTITDAAGSVATVDVGATAVNNTLL